MTKFRYYVPLFPGAAVPAAIDIGVGRAPGTLAIRSNPIQVRGVARQIQGALVAELGADAKIKVQTVSELEGPELRPWRLGAGLFSAAGILALVVAAVGIYSSVSYTVGQRRHEMGVRAA